MRINSYSLNLSSQYNYFYTASSKSVETEDEIRATLNISEKERLALSAFGNVKTSDKTISFSADSMLSAERALSIESVSKKIKMADPLVLNLSSQIAQVDEKNRFSFDIDNDGKKDNISLLDSNNGFLAFDKNGDGSINDGSELFGAKSGDGFRELSEYDSTKDGVIDENDNIFDKLKIWIKTALQDELISLKDVRVGALILDNVKSSFKLMGDEGVNAQIKKSGVALFEDGRVGWMSHIDFVAREEKEKDGDDTPKTIHTNAPKTSQINSQTNQNDGAGESEVDLTLKRLKRELQEISSKLQQASSIQEQRVLEGQRVALVEQISTLERTKVENGLA